MKKKNNSNESGSYFQGIIFNMKNLFIGLAYGIIGLAGLALGALGTFLFNKVSDEEDEKEKEKEILLLKQEVAQKNRVIQAEKLKDDQQKNGYTSTNSENLLENENLYCPISNGLDLEMNILF